MGGFSIKFIKSQSKVWLKFAVYVTKLSNFAHSLAEVCSINYKFSLKFWESLSNIS